MYDFLGDPKLLCLERSCVRKATQNNYCDQHQDETNKGLEYNIEVYSQVVKHDRGKRIIRSTKGL